MTEASDKKEFVVQYHVRPDGGHYDFMVEEGQALATFRLSGPPGELAVGENRLITRLPDHRRAYLTYEGPIGGGRGAVRIVDRGVCEMLAADDRRWVFDLRGQHVSGSFELEHVEGDRYRLSRIRPA